MSTSPLLPIFATTHGDHTVKVISTATFKVEKELKGHPRTPWCVKFHPTNPDLLASGCLGMQVRIWDLPSSSTLRMVKLENPVISLSWEWGGSGEGGGCGGRIAAAVGTKVEMWDCGNNLRVQHEKNHPIRAVRFLPSGRLLLAVQSPSFYKTDLTTGNLLRIIGPPSPSLPPNSKIHHTFRVGVWEELDNKWLETGVVAERAVLYNDGGMDERDGEVVCICVDHEGAKEIEDEDEREQEER
ncbi:hypothetical protein TrCOL_g10770 [Triparma columacea]|uniref:Uncharacterized protein n=1 Tax=Triparma columacea TaxID=722753 RepID=A0A9W7GP32_9STRA|nr:hypothetical protein TrCOL_g10770 [Triparma columacea]